MWHGVPFDLAFGIDDEVRAAFAIVFSEMESGKRLNWKTGEFEEPPK